MYCIGVGVCKIFFGKGFVGLRSGSTSGTGFFEFWRWVEEWVEETSPNEEPDSTDSASAISSSACSSSSTSSPCSILSTPSSGVTRRFNFGDSSFAGVDLGRGIGSGVDSDRGLLRWVRDPERRRCLAADGNDLCPDIVLNSSCTTSTAVLMGLRVTDYKEKSDGAF